MVGVVVAVDAAAPFFSATRRGAAEPTVRGKRVASAFGGGLVARAVCRVDRVRQSVESDRVDEAGCAP